MSTRSVKSAPALDTSVRSRRPLDRRTLIAGLACLSAAVVLLAWKVFGTSDNDHSFEQESNSQAQTEPASRVATRTATTFDASAANPFELVDDDGQSLWMSPTQGTPLDLAYLPPGVQLVVALRPQALANSPERRKVIDALGPIGQRYLATLDDVFDNPQGMDCAVVGLSTTSDGNWQTTVVARLSGNSTAAQHLEATLPNAAEKTHHGIKFLVENDRAYFAPAADAQLLVIAPAATMTEIIDLNGDPPPLRREVERLLPHTDAERHFTVIVAPSVLFSEGRRVFSGQMEPLRAPLFWFLGDEFGAAALSLHWDDDFFVELLAVPTLDTSPERAARVLAERVAQIPERLEEYVVALDAQPYGRRILARFPAMVRKLVAYTRSGYDPDHAVMRCYLPAIAGHNLLMGTELTLAESIGGRRLVTNEASESRTVADFGELRRVEATAPSGAVSFRERLQRKTSLSFPRDTLEVALEQLSRDIGVDIEIRGADLQAEGITKNQSFGIDLTNRPAEEILVEILRLANPDKSASGPGDVRQKLVYVIAAEPGSVERIVITTRDAAAGRGDELPPVFRPG